MLGAADMRILQSYLILTTRCTMSCDTSRFRQPPTDKDGIVKLVFTKTADQQALYVHSCILRLWSPVLGGMLDALSSASGDSRECKPEGLVFAQPAVDSSSSEFFTIPLDEADTTAWEEALSFMYPVTPLACVTWDNASRLLVLADKYDMACIIEQVKNFLGGGGSSNTMVASNLARHLTDTNVFSWWSLTTSIGLDSHAEICVNHIASRRLSLPLELANSMAPKHLHQLYEAARVQAVADAEVASRARQQASDELARVKWEAADALSQARSDAAAALSQAKKETAQLLSDYQRVRQTLRSYRKHP